MLSINELKELVTAMLEYQLALIMALQEKGDPSQGHHPDPSSSTSPDWCKCGKCCEMPTDQERKCCGYIPANCLSEHPFSIDFANFLQPSTQDIIHF